MRTRSTPHQKVVERRRGAAGRHAFIITHCFWFAAHKASQNKNRRWAVTQECRVTTAARRVTPRSGRYAPPPWPPPGGGGPPAAAHCFFICISGAPANERPSRPETFISFRMRFCHWLAAGRRPAQSHWFSNWAAIRRAEQGRLQLAAEIIVFFLWSGAAGRASDPAPARRRAARPVAGRPAGPAACRIDLAPRSATEHCAKQQRNSRAGPYWSYSGSRPARGATGVCLVSSGKRRPVDWPRTEGLARDRGTGSGHKDWLRTEGLARDRGTGSGQRDWFRTEETGSGQSDWLGDRVAGSGQKGLTRDREDWLGMQKDWVGT